LFNTIRNLVLTFFAFQQFPAGERVALFSSVDVRQKGLKEIEE